MNEQSAWYARTSKEAGGIIFLLEEAQDKIRDEMRRQFDNGNNRFKINCLLDARVNVLRAIEALYENEQLSSQP
jgi:hypothetical protein